MCVPVDQWIFLHHNQEEISVLDISGDIASAKPVAWHWVDWLTLSKWNGEWKIVSVVLRGQD